MDANVQTLKGLADAALGQIEHFRLYVRDADCRQLPSDPAYLEYRRSAITDLVILGRALKETGIDPIMALHEAGIGSDTLSDSRSNV